MGEALHFDNFGYRVLEIQNVCIKIMPPEGSLNTSCFIFMIFKTIDECYFKIWRFPLKSIINNDFEQLSLHFQNVNQEKKKLVMKSYVILIIFHCLHSLINHPFI